MSKLIQIKIQSLRLPYSLESLSERSAKSKWLQIMDLFSVSPGWRRVSFSVAIGAALALIAFWHFSTRLPPVPQRPLRIGFESNPPVQIRTENGFSGLAVETVNEAAKR